MLNDLCDPVRCGGASKSSFRVSYSTANVWRALGAVTKRCRATSPATVDGALPSSRAISRHEAPRSSILSMELRSCLASLEYDLSDGGLPLTLLLAISGSNLLGAGLSGPRQQIGSCGAWSSTQLDVFRWVRDVFR